MSEVQQLCLPLLQQIQDGLDDIRVGFAQLGKTMQEQTVQLDRILDLCEKKTGLSRQQVNKLKLRVKGFQAQL